MYIAYSSIPINAFLSYVAYLLSQIDLCRVNYARGHSNGFWQQLI